MDKALRMRIFKKIACDVSTTVRTWYWTDRALKQKKIEGAYMRFGVIRPSLWA